MFTSQAKGGRLHGQIRRALQCGRFAPVERLEPAALAFEFDTSLTHVRFALHHLSGSGRSRPVGRVEKWQVCDAAAFPGRHDRIERPLVARSSLSADRSGVIARVRQLPLHGEDARGLGWARATT